ncbi:MAG: ROK family protein, partial [Bdellovibrionales bacterium]
MKAHIGIDIGGTKIAAGAYSPDGALTVQATLPTPNNFEGFLQACETLVAQSAGEGGDRTIGVCSAGAVDPAQGLILSENIPYLNDKPVRSILADRLGCPVRLANDMNCLALAEALEGAGRGHAVVHAITLSTGVGSGLVVNGRLLQGANNLAGEIGHLPLPFRTEQDSPLHPCICKQQDCVEKAICGAGLSRLYQAMTGKDATPPEISALARQGESQALSVLDRYYHMVAKALILSLHFLDPDVIILSGGLSRLPNICQEVSARWGAYCLFKDIQTKLVLASYGPLAGLRGAALLGMSPS